jgi:hypothetical protein
MRCPACGARNSDDATWCTQCYADVRPRPVPEPSAGTNEAARPAVPDQHATPQRPAAPVDRDVRDRDGVVEWRCAACDGWTELESPTCAVCGSPRRGFGELAAAPARSTSEGAIVGASLLVPGLGHMLAGRYGTGIARAGLAGVHAALGFDIGSQTVPEIAISIVAELIACRNLPGGVAPRAATPPVGVQAFACRSLQPSFSLPPLESRL